MAGDGEISYTELARLCGRRTLSLPGGLLRPAMSLSWKLRLQGESPPGGLEFIRYPPVISTEKLKDETGFSFEYSSKEAVRTFLDTL